MSLDFVGSPNFSDRSLPRHSANGRRSRAGSRASSFDHRLSIIAEDGNVQPAKPAQTHNRPFSRRFLGEPPRYTNGHRPPQYTLWDVTGPKGEKFQDLRDNAYVAKRGGWKRICLIALIIITCIVALIVGLAVGLHKRSSSNSIPASPSSTSSPITGPFPAGSWTFTTFLDSQSAACTSQNSSWKCEPAVTYASSPTNSEAIFNWIIDSTGPNSFTISSTDNPFAIDFNNATLSRVGSGSSNERYTFTTTVQKVVFPSFNVKCYYNTTQFTGDLYTKRPKSYPPDPTASATSSAAAAMASNGPAGIAAGGAFANWAFAVDATQSVGGGQDVPACYNYNANTGQVGDLITTGYTVMPATDFCSCAYKNYDP